LRRILAFLVAREDCTHETIADHFDIFSKGKGRVKLGSVRFDPKLFPSLDDNKQTIKTAVMEYLAKEGIEIPPTIKERKSFRASMGSTILPDFAEATSVSAFPVISSLGTPQ